MKTAIKLFGILIGLTIIFTTCSKIKEPQRACLLTSAIQGKRKIDFIYDSNRRLSMISDYTDSTLLSTSNTVTFHYDAFGQLVYIAENLANGLSDSIAFGYFGSYKVAETQYIKTSDGYSINYTKSYLFDVSGNLANDTLYSIENGAKGQQITRYSTYEYDQNNNVKTLENYNSSGTLNFSASYEYGDTLVLAPSYAIVRFTILQPFESNYQYVLPNRKNLVYMERLNSGGNSTLNTYSYDLDSKGNALTENKVVSDCGACTTTTTYKYNCN